MTWWGRLAAALLFLVMFSRIKISNEDTREEGSIYIGQDSLSVFAPLTQAPSLNGASENTIKNNDSFVGPHDNETPIEAPLVNTVNLTAVGDLMVHQWQLDSAYNASSATYDFRHGFELVTPYLTAADFTIGNLETTFAGRDMGISEYPRFNTPDEFGEALRDTGFDLLSTANNHTNDKNAAGIFRTLDVLDSLDIGHTGSYRSKEESEQLTIVNVNGIDIAFLSYTYGTNGIPLQYDWSMNLLEDEKIEADILQACSIADFIIVIPHMGDEYVENTSEAYRARARAMLKLGADMVLASHPHVVQPYEFVTVTDDDGSERNCFIIYSLGNFISSQRTLPRDQGIILNASIEQHGGDKPVIKSVSFVPTWVRFINSSGAYDIQTLSIFDALTGAVDVQGLREQDKTRMRNAHTYITNHLLGYPVGIEDMQNEYFVYP
ncbi:MAG: CapA family protein [Clostridiales bacterium]|nr:CapA family protein [Clostridiales bacterium]